MKRFLTSPAVGPFRMWHLLGAIAGIYVLIGAVGLAVLVKGIKAATTKKGTRGSDITHASRGILGRVPSAVVAVTPMGESLREGDLQVTIRGISTGGYAGQHYNRFAVLEGSCISIEVMNTSKGKIFDWPGWQGHGEIVDEHGNTFKSFRLSGWDWLPKNEPDINHGPTFLERGMDGPARLSPGQKYVTYLYFEFIPPTSKHVTITLPLYGRLLKFSGQPGTEAIQR